MKPRKPEVSVIVLTYNQSDSIGRTLDSILAQQCNFPYEIIISDDSTDSATRQAIEPYVKAFPSVVHLLPKHPQLGVVRNYFHALAHCSGELIADCAGDDYWYGFDGLQLKRDIMMSHPDAAFVHSDWLLRDVRCYDCTLTPSDADGWRQKYRRSYTSGAQLIPVALSASGGPLIHLSTVLYRKAIIDEALAANPSFVQRAEWGSEDLPVIAALLASNRAVCWLPKATLVYSIGGNTLTSPQSLASAARYYVASAIMVMQLAEHYHIPAKAVAKAINAKTHHAISQAILSRDKELIAELKAIVASHKIRRPILDRLKESIKSLLLRFKH